MFNFFKRLIIGKNKNKKINKIDIPIIDNPNKREYNKFFRTTEDNKNIARVIQKTPVGTHTKIAESVTIKGINKYKADALKVIYSDSYYFKLEKNYNNNQNKIKVIGIIQSKFRKKENKFLIGYIPKDIVKDIIKYNKIEPTLRAIHYPTSSQSIKIIIDIWGDKINFETIPVDVDAYIKKMNIDKLGNPRMRVSMVPDSEELDNNPVYYVYEWFIKENNEVFYIGKGKGERYQEEKRNVFFNKIINNFECDTRIIEDGLTEHEALILEEDLIQKRHNEGYVLTNMKVVNMPSVFGDPNLQYMKPPNIYPSLVEKHYLNIQEKPFDKIKIDNLKYTHFIKHVVHIGTEKLYYKKPDNLDREEVKIKINNLIENATKEIEELGGRVYKTKAKSVKSVIYSNAVSYHQYENEKNKNYDVYHLIDVLNFLEKYNTNK